MKLWNSPFALLSALLGLSLVGNAGCGDDDDDDAADDDAADDDAADDDAADDDTADDDTATDDDTFADDDTFTVEYDEPNAIQWGYAIWPVYSAGVLAGYEMQFTLYYLDFDQSAGTADTVCDEVYLGTSDFDTTPGAWDCPGCLGSLQNWTLTYYGSGDDECVFENPEDWFNETILLDPANPYVGSFQVMVGDLPDSDPFIDIQGVYDSVDGAGLDSTHGTFLPDSNDVDGDGDLTELITWGIYYAQPGTWNADFTTGEQVEIGGAPTMAFYYLTWWLFTLG